MSTRQKNASPPAPQLANGADTGEVEIVVADGAEGDAAVTIDEGTAPDPGIEDLRKQLAEEQRRRETAELEAQALRGARQQDHREVVDNRLLVLDATIQRQESDKKSILTRIKDAKEAGDYDAEVTALDELSQINGDLKQTKLGKARLETEIEEGGQRTTTRSDGADDPIERFITANNTHPKAANWLRNHRDYALDAGKNASLLRAHNFALGHDDVEMNSDRYFELLEQKLGLRDAPQEEGERTTTTQRTSSAPAAPVSRSAGMGGGGREITKGIVDLGNGKYRASPEIKEFAESIGMTLKDYIDNAVALKNAGQLH